MTRRRQWLTLAAVAVGVFITAIDNSIVNVALPSIQRDLDLGLTGIAWVVNGYILSFAVLLLTGGRLADSFGDVASSSSASPGSPAHHCSPASPRARAC